MKYAWIVFTLMGLVTVVAQEPAPVQSVRSSVREWVLAQKTLSQEAAQWKNEQSLMADLVDVLKQDRLRLKKEIAASEEQLSQADAQRDALLAKRQANEASRAQVRTFLIGIEARVLKLEKRLPEPLREQVAPFVGKIRANSTRTRMGIAERMQSVIGLLDAVRSFDKKLTVVRAVREYGDKPAREVTVLYVGLAQAYYLSSDGAGVGFPSDQGWLWESRPELGASIGEAIALAEGVDHEPRFIELPLQIDGGLR